MSEYTNLKRPHLALLKIENAPTPDAVRTRGFGIRSEIPTRPPVRGEDAPISDAARARGYGIRSEIPREWRTDRVEGRREDGRGGVRLDGHGRVYLRGESGRRETRDLREFYLQEYPRPSPQRTHGGLRNGRSEGGRDQREQSPQWPLPPHRLDIMEMDSLPRQQGDQRNSRQEPLQPIKEQPAIQPSPRMNAGPKSTTKATPSTEANANAKPTPWVELTSEQRAHFSPEERVKYFVDMRRHKELEREAITNAKIAGKFFLSIKCLDLLPEGGLLLFGEDGDIC